MEQMHTMVTDGTSRLRSGMELVLTKWIALSGTARIAQKKEEELLKKFPEPLIREAKNFDGLLDTALERELAEDAFLQEIYPEKRKPSGGDALFGENEYYPLGEGGILAALWEMADRAGLGLTADLRKIPIRQETVEITELFDVNPYGLDSKGALLIGTFHGMELVERLRRADIPAAIIGRVDPGPERVIYNQGVKRYVDKPARDEIYKLFPEE